MCKLAHSCPRQTPLLLLILALSLSPLLPSAAWAAHESALIAPGPSGESGAGAGTDGDGGGPGLPNGEGDPDDLELTPPIVASVLSSGKYVYLTI